MKEIQIVFDKPKQEISDIDGVILFYPYRISLENGVNCLDCNVCLKIPGRLVDKLGEEIWKKLKDNSKLYKIFLPNIIEKIQTEIKSKRLTKLLELSIKNSDLMQNKNDFLLDVKGQNILMQISEEEESAIWKKVIY